MRPVYKGKRVARSMREEFGDIMYVMVVEDEARLRAEVRSPI